MHDFPFLSCHDTLVANKTLRNLFSRDVEKSDCMKKEKDLPFCKT